MFQSEIFESEIDNKLFRYEVCKGLGKEWNTASQTSKQMDCNEAFQPTWITSGSVIPASLVRM